MGLHLEISQIRLARKANSRVQHLSPGNLPLAGFDVTPEGGHFSPPDEFCINGRFSARKWSGSLMLCNSR